MTQSAARAGIYNSRQPSRCVVAAPGGEQGRHRFIVGTCGLQQTNALHLVEFSEDSAEILCRQTLPHDDEVWLLAVSPTDGRNILTYSAGGSPPTLRLWRSGDLEATEGSLQLTSSLTDGETSLEGAVKSLLWDPHQEGSAVAVDSENLHVFQGSGSGRFSRSLTFHVGQRCHRACIDPHHPHQVSTVDDTTLKTWDLRVNNKPSFTRDNTHLFGACDVDYNPNVPYQVMTSGEDATIRFWDLRKLSECKKSLSGGHHHWITRARYNSHHDQLVISCGSDSAACLWRASSVASKPLGAESPKEENQSQAPLEDGLIKRFEDYEDSCYSCCWSALDAWVFAAVSFDGKLVVNRVPSEEKYRILL